MVAGTGIAGMVRAAGYDGRDEIEILSERDWWARDPNAVAKTVKARHASHV